MKYARISSVLILLFFVAIYVSGSEKDNCEKNKKLAEKYHELEASDVDVLLCEDFVGRNEKSTHTWNKKDHFKFLSNGVYKGDSICHQVAEGDWVATRFVRTIDLNGEKRKFELMHFKKFKNGMIAEIWEYGKSIQDE